MQRNTKLYTEARELKLAFASDFQNFTTIRGKFIGTFKPNIGWVSMDTVPGTLVNSRVSDGGKPAIYTLNIKFRVSYDCLENALEIETWSKQPVVASFVNGSGKRLIYGSKESHLRLSYTKPEGFEGYECELTGASMYGEVFI